MFDTHEWVHHNGVVGDRVKRTYNLDSTIVQRVRELASEYGVARSQDAVVELAVERLYAHMRDQEEADQWAMAAQDSDFRAEAGEIASEMRDGEAWPS
jgi:hypothetical protein